MFINQQKYHIAIIMDGNGRWAKQRHLPHIEGHRRGAQTLKTIVEHSLLLDIKYLSVFAFSTENWQRSSLEINGLMNLLRYYLQYELTFFNKNNIRLQIIGNLDKLPQDIVSQIKQAIDQTHQNDGLNLTIAVSYGGKEEIINASKNLAQDFKIGKIKLEEIDEEKFCSYMYSYNLPMIDLLIRTSGEQRISNFMLWHAAYAELFFTDTYWPDFTCDELDQILENYKYRERRFGSRLPSEIT